MTNQEKYTNGVKGNVTLENATNLMAHLKNNPTEMEFVNRAIIEQATTAEKLLMYSLPMAFTVPIVNAVARKFYDDNIKMDDYGRSKLEAIAEDIRTAFWALHKEAIIDHFDKTLYSDNTDNTDNPNNNDEN